MRGSLYRIRAPPLSPLLAPRSRDIRPRCPRHPIVHCLQEPAAINRTYITLSIKYTVAHEQRASAGENATRRDTFLLSLHQPLRTFPR